MNMQLWLQLGLGGAALFLLFNGTNKLFKYLDNKTKSDSGSIKTLCTKIDKLVDSYHVSMQRTIADSKCVEMTKDSVDALYDLMVDTKILVERIELKTSQCLKE